MQMLTDYNERFEGFLHTGGITQPCKFQKPSSLFGANAQLSLVQHPTTDRHDFRIQQRSLNTNQLHFFLCSSLLDPEFVLVHHHKKMISAAMSEVGSLRRQEQGYTI